MTPRERTLREAAYALRCNGDHDLADDLFDLADDIGDDQSREKPDRSDIKRVPQPKKELPPVIWVWFTRTENEAGNRNRRREWSAKEKPMATKYYRADGGAE